MRFINHKVIFFSIFSLLVLALPDAVAGKEKQGGRLSITDIQVSNVSDSIQLSFNCTPERFAIRKKERVIVTPVLSDGSHYASFASFVIVGKKGKVPFIRSAGYRKDMEVIGCQQTLAYHANVRYEEWMKGSVLTFKSSAHLCAKQAILTTAVVDGKILQDPDVEIVKIVEVVEPALSVADKLAQDYGFLANVSQKSEFSEADREESVSILFRSGSSVILADYQDNERNLELLVSTINQINQSPDSRISDILIVGYASPEGDYRLNQGFAEARATALKKYLIQRTEVGTESFSMINGGVDWFGLSQLVNESDMPEKEEVLKIIDPPFIQTDKEKQDRRIRLMHLKGGLPYRYMLQNFFPKLRSGTCIKVFYENIDKENR